ncbi:hypothetical protein [Paenibacillus sp. B2(2019)]|nr:hypothetical protein [Paenibacillus sp. B2(2019)]
MLAVIYSSVAVVLRIILPVFTFEKPTGTYKIGTVTLIGGIISGQKI